MDFSDKADCPEGGVKGFKTEEAQRDMKKKKNTNKKHNST
jgi:hypothetical protein